MNRREAFDAWKERKSREDAGPQFADRVMTDIRCRNAARAGGTMRSLLRSIAARPWARTAAMIVGTLFGLARIVATLRVILFA